MSTDLLNTLTSSFDMSIQARRVLLDGIRDNQDNPELVNTFVDFHQALLADLGVAEFLTSQSENVLSPFTSLSADTQLAFRQILECLIHALLFGSCESFGELIPPIVDLLAEDVCLCDRFFDRVISFIPQGYRTESLSEYISDAKKFFEGAQNG